MDGLYLYFIKCEGFVKIGISKKPHVRIQTLQIGSPFKYNVIGTIQVEVAYKLEKEIHWLFEEYNERGEWFRLEGALKNWLENILPKVDGFINEKELALKSKAGIL